MANVGNQPNHPARSTGGVESFLNPQSMLTPGVAGALTMMIANVLAIQFAMPRAWTGLGLSFLFGLLVFVSGITLFLRIIYYVINSLIIFCVAIGSNTVGLATAGGAAVNVGVLVLAPPAFAQTTPAPSLDTTAVSGLALKLEDLSKQLVTVSTEIESSWTSLEALKASGKTDGEITVLTQKIDALEAAKQSILQDTLLLTEQIQHEAIVTPSPPSRDFFAPWKF